MVVKLHLRVLHMVVKLHLRVSPVPSRRQPLSPISSAKMEMKGKRRRRRRRRRSTWRPREVEAEIVTT